MYCYKGKRDITITLDKSEQQRLDRGFVVHCYGASHYAKGGEVVAAKLELPHVQQYQTLGYTLVETLGPARFRQGRIRIPRTTPAVRQAQALLRDAQGLSERAALLQKQGRKVS